MTIQDNLTEDELDEIIERIEEANFKYFEMLERVKRLRVELEIAEQELEVFVNDNREYLAAP